MNVRAAAVVPCMQLSNVSRADETFTILAENSTSTLLHACGQDYFRVVYHVALAASLDLVQLSQLQQPFVVHDDSGRVI
jgi:hypothetical protein